MWSMGLLAEGDDGYVGEEDTAAKACEYPEDKAAYGLLGDWLRGHGSLVSGGLGFWGSP